MTIDVAEADGHALEDFCRRQLKWDARLQARIVTTRTALGIFTAPPLGVLAFMAIPRTGDIEVVDITVRLTDFADAIASGAVNLDDLPHVPVLAAPPPSLSHLPPSDGWQVPMQAVSSDLVALVADATVEFRDRSVGRPPAAQEEVADEIWSRPAFAGLPLRTLHAARQLGMLTSDSARVAAATSGQWKRLSTLHGQVFAYATGPAARLALRVV